MNKKKVDFRDYANEIVKATPGGILLTTAYGDKINTMTIGWAGIGTNWSVPVFIAFVRKHRYTIEMLKKNPEFTINVPLGDVNKKILGFCGTKHGDEVDKVKEMNLTPVESDIVKVPGFKELPLTLECKVVYSQSQSKEIYAQYDLMKHYPQDVDERAPGGNCDPHITFFGEIVNAYIIED